MKNLRAKHDWQVTGGYDAEQDGPDPRWGRVAIECRTCGETRRVFCSLADPRVAYGCRRYGGDKWQQGDFLVRDGWALDQFESWLPDGRVRTCNAGGNFYESEPSALRPWG